MAATEARTGRVRTPCDEERVLDEVGRVLNRISESGLGSLSEQELDLLDRISRKYRQN